MKKYLSLAILCSSVSVNAFEINDHIRVLGLVGAYQTNGGPLAEGSKDGNPIEAKVRLNGLANYEITDGWYLFGRMEYDLNFLNLKEGTEIKNGKIRKRYEYIGIEHAELGNLWFGKDWGATYVHMPILKMKYLGFQDVLAGQAAWRNSDTLLYKNQFGKWGFVASTQLSDSTRDFDYKDDAFTTDGNAFTITYGTSPFFGEGFGIGYSYHDAGLYGPNGDLYKDKGDATHNIGANYRYGQWYIGATIAKSDLNDNGKNADLNKYTWDVAAEYTFNDSLKFVLHHAQIYGNWGNENERFVGYGVHYNVLTLSPDLTLFIEGRVSDGGDSNTIEDTHVFGMEYSF
ncbi:porin [Photobacterium minamisatsumaniensis]|uniref:porin n=1 Tax=Photobacterium minamisatsumaniensis TaxID=2910233 RepID=UPI003D117F17